MFKKELGGRLVSPKENAFKYTDDYKSLMQFVKLNKKIPEKLDIIAKSQTELENVAILENAIKTADLKNKIFSNPNCQLYSIYLLSEKLTEKKISMEDFLDVNIYLIALMQFTDKQSLKKEDEEVKTISKLEIVKIDDAEVKKLFIEQFKKIHYEKNPNDEFNEQLFESELNKLSDLGKMVIKIELPGCKDDIVSPVEETMLITHSTGLLPMDDQYCFYIPSSSLSNVFMKMINKDLTMKMAPILGEVNPYTLYLMHQLGFHPVELYSCEVRDNPKKVHDARCGPLPTLLHDSLVHVYWGNLLQQKQFQFLFHYLIPKIGALLDINFANTNIEETLPNFYRVIDLDIALPHAQITPNLLLNYSIKMLTGLGNPDQFIYNIEGALKVFTVLYKEKDLIQKEYNIDLKSVLNSPIFEKLFSDFSGKEIYSLLEEANNKNISPLDLYKEKFEPQLTKFLMSKYERFL